MSERHSADESDTKRHANKRDKEKDTPTDREIQRQRRDKTE